MKKHLASFLIMLSVVAVNNGTASFWWIFDEPECPKSLL
ncbi:MAG: cyclic lactone autoinducer peptide [Mollicutes bacterium]|nr:cyclic lactone autoinducer peptide [Mollicutes bacterium]